MEKFGDLFYIDFNIFRLILLLEEYSDVLPLIYSEESTEKYMKNSFDKLVDKLLYGQTESNTAEYISHTRSKYGQVAEKQSLAPAQRNNLVQNI